ncbi:glycine cleavage T C-terminal barrel domain-containing protein [Polyangium sp. 6x1]|uniref:CAF17-like 4Fe-4S cluster assembly/insertion protein YgfZ n=1 Tax=Polyangium sp. 6x1 TaxID=3042689 RepID=UPI002482C23F|nr:glycine cleavage T C-terminal barrel domain-containing protein [Polyangium sp. 6x1]MDI1448281.1 glycine cleavage T C-terminal barrel domain-containing protein [Polyangium sp. 6x1]
MSENDIAPLRRALAEGALLLRAPELGTLSVRGKDRQTWLNGMITCDLAPLKAGQGAYGFAVAKTGKILAELRILIDDDRILVGAPRDRIATLIEHFDHYVIMEDVELEDASADVAWIVAHGPGSKDLPALARAHGALAAASVDTSGKGGALFAFEPAAADAALGRLERKGSPPVLLAEEAAWEALRVEIGLGRWGKDFSEENYPQEASLEPLTVSFQKGCYLGQEAVFMLQMRGHVKKKLVPISIEGDAEVPASAEITDPTGKVIGNVTSAAKGTEAGRVLAIGYVKYKQATKGTAISVAGRPAVVS